MRAAHRATDEVTRAIEGFSDGSVPVLVATDIAARGIDVADVSLVVHIEPPAEHKAYLHRAGRTARGGAAGTVVTLVMDEQREEISALINKAGVTATEHDISERDNPAGAPALKEGDVINSIDGVATKDPKTYLVTLRSKDIGQTITVGYNSGGNQKSVTMQTAAGS